MWRGISNIRSEGLRIILDNIREVMDYSGFTRSMSLRNQIAVIEVLRQQYANQIDAHISYLDNPPTHPPEVLEGMIHRRGIYLMMDRAVLHTVDEWIPRYRRQYENT